MERQNDELSHTTVPSPNPGQKKSQNPFSPFMDVSLAAAVLPRAIRQQLQHLWQTASQVFMEMPCEKPLLHLPRWKSGEQEENNNNTVATTRREISINARCPTIVVWQRQIGHVCLYCGFHGFMTSQSQNLLCQKRSILAGHLIYSSVCKKFTHFDISIKFEN